MADEFKVGDTVRIKSALMPMSIVAIHDEQAICVWYNNDNDLKECRLPLACLALIDPSDLKMP